ncbi:Imm40 family immunity protein [Algoriphagus vanfongensis]|uniref:Imm40 family immunity protein n=1 Tax=Algoriphagus vanfongensis TaxID=426371 RepID=UPI00041AD124|nr:Imm40 family immunity protein [Algoriphagus vanfongensis]
MTETKEKYLPTEILQKAIVSGREYGWKRTDFRLVIDKAIEVGLTIIGGQVQFKLPDGTCELYWQKYDTAERKPGENWDDYCQRTKRECLRQFEKFPTDSELVKEGIECFDFLKEKSKTELNLKDYLIFILYFNDSESSLNDRV